MDTVKEWILAIAVCAVIIEILDILMPDGSMRKTAFIICGIVLSTCIIIPAASIYDNLKLIEFNYEEGRENIIENKDQYTEEQIMGVTTEFKGKLAKHIEDMVLDLKNISACQAEVIIEEDYNSEKYGTIYRIYIEAEEAKEDQEKKRSSGFSEYGKIERIEIGIDGIIIKERDDNKEEQIQDETTGEIAELIGKEFELDTSNIFVEVIR